MGCATLTGNFHHRQLRPFIRRRWHAESRPALSLSGLTKSRLLRDVDSARHCAAAVRNSQVQQKHMGSARSAQYQHSRQRVSAPALRSGPLSPRLGRRKKKFMARPLTAILSAQDDAAVLHDAGKQPAKPVTACGSRRRRRACRSCPLAGWQSHRDRRV